MFLHMCLVLVLFPSLAWFLPCKWCCKMGQQLTVQWRSPLSLLTVTGLTCTMNRQCGYTKLLSIKQCQCLIIGSVWSPVLVGKKWTIRARNPCMVSECSWTPDSWTLTSQPGLSLSHRPLLAWDCKVVRNKQWTRWWRMNAQLLQAAVQPGCLYN